MRCRRARDGARPLSAMGRTRGASPGVSGHPERSQCRRHHGRGSFIRAEGPGLQGRHRSPRQSQDAVHHLLGTQSLRGPRGLPRRPVAHQRPRSGATCRQRSGVQPVLHRGSDRSRAWRRLRARGAAGERLPVPGRSFSRERPGPPVLRPRRRTAHHSRHRPADADQDLRGPGPDRPILELARTAVDRARHHRDRPRDPHLAAVALSPSDGDADRVGYECLLPVASSASASAVLRAATAG